MGKLVTPIDVMVMGEYLMYQPESGNLIWIKKPAKKVVVGHVAGFRKSGGSGYWMIKFMGRPYLAHRVCWAIHNGRDIPRGYEIDHVNGDKSDNRASNLRLALPHENKSNMECLRGVSGVRGVTWNKGKARWQAQISHKNKCIFLGYFEKLEDAKCARKEAEKAIHSDYAYAASRKLDEDHQ